LAATAVSDLEFVSSVPFGGAYTLEHLWHQLKIDQIVGRVGQPKRGRRRDMTATRAGAVRPGRQLRAGPSSKLAAADWITSAIAVAWPISTTLAFAITAPTGASGTR
jgi:hypothetical protein